MNAVKSSVQFLGYRVIDAKYSELDIELPQNIEFDVSPQFYREILSNGEEWKIRLGVKIGSDDEQKSPLPFSVTVILEGTFSIEGFEEPDKEKIMKINGTSIMFPYLRSTLSLLMSLANMPPILLPTINLSKTFELENRKDSD